jgi:uncharacterized membrane protein
VKKTLWKILHTIFRVNIFIKGIRGVLEIILGIILLVVPLDIIQRFLVWFLELEILFEAIQKTAIYVDLLTPGIMKGLGLYFIVLGSCKILVFYGVWHNKLKLYPIAGAMLVFFAIYQFVLLIITFSPLVLLWFTFNLVTITLMRIEYLKLSHKLKLEKG